MDKKRQSVRELELARSLARLLEILPLGYAQSIVSALYNLIITQTTESIKYEITTEAPVSLNKNTGKGRLDILIPLQISDFNEVIFETKLGTENLDQVKGYAESRKNALVVSIAKYINISNDNFKNIVRLTWTDFFKGLYDILGQDAKERLISNNKIKTKADFSPTYPPFYVGVTTESYIEDFLRDLLQKELVDVEGEKVLVVTGEFATESCQKYNIQIISNSWDQRFDYVCVVYEKQLKYIGKVVDKKIFDDDEFSDADKENYRLQELVKLDENKNVIQNLSDPWTATIVKLDPINDPSSDDKWNEITLEKKYNRKGAITQSHRYFNTVKDFINHFNSED